MLLSLERVEIDDLNARDSDRFLLRRCGLDIFFFDFEKAVFIHSSGAFDLILRQIVCSLNTHRISVLLDLTVYLTLPFRNFLQSPVNDLATLMRRPLDIESFTQVH